MNPLQHEAHSFLSQFISSCWTLFIVFRILQSPEKKIQSQILMSVPSIVSNKKKSWIVYFRSDWRVSTTTRLDWKRTTFHAGMELFPHTLLRTSPFRVLLCEFRTRTNLERSGRVVLRVLRFFKDISRK